MSGYRLYLVWYKGLNCYRVGLITNAFVHVYTISYQMASSVNVLFRITGPRSKLVMPRDSSPCLLGRFSSPSGITVPLAFAMAARTLLPSARRPLTTSQRGDSGIILKCNCNQTMHSIFL